MVDEDKINDEKYERIKDNINRFSYIDLIIWRNEMIASSSVNNRLFHLLNNEILERANEIGLYKEKRNNK